MNNRIRILSTSDVHGCIYPYSYSDGKEINGSFSRLKTLIDSLRDENTIVIDNGDTIEGSPLTFYHYAYHPDEVCPATEAMNQIDYDFINLGNHDFNYGEKCLSIHLKHLKGHLLTSNVLLNGNSLGPSYVIRNISGKRIAFTAVTTQYVPNWEDPSHIKNMTFLDAKETLKKNIAGIKKENPDCIIAMYHGGFERDLETGEPVEDLTGENEGYAILQEIPEIDVLIAGHKHVSVHGKAFGTCYTETAADGKALACIDIEKDEIKTSILDVTAEADQAILKACRKEETECQKWLDTPLGESRVNLEVNDEADARLHKSQMITFLNQVEQEATAADLCSNALFLGAKGFHEKITMRDIVSTYVFPNTLVVKRINGRILREYLEKTAQFWTVKDGKIIVNPSMDFPTPQHFNYDMVDGIAYTIKASNPDGKKIISLKYQGENVKDDQVFTLAVNNYRAAGGGGYPMIKNAETVREISSSMVELIAQYILKHHVIDFKPVNNIQVIL